MTNDILWLSPTDFVTGDTSLRISYPSVTHPAVEIKTSTRGDLKWVYLGLKLPLDSDIHAFHVGYQLSNPRSFISQVRLTEMGTPDHAVVRHDDGTDLRSTAPTSYRSQLAAGYRPEGAVTLQLRLNFQNVADTITLGAIGVEMAAHSATLLPAYTLGTRPAAGNPGSLVRLTDGIRGLYLDTGATWAHLFGEVVDVKRDFGAKGDGDTVDDAAIQGAINAVLDGGGGTAYFPRGEYLTTSPLVVEGNGIRLLGTGRGGRGGTRIVNITSDLIQLGNTINVNNFECRNMWLATHSSDGHVFNVGGSVSGMCLDGLYLSQGNPHRSIWEQSGQEYIDNLVLNCFLEHVGNATAPAWRHYGGTVNSNTWMRCRASLSGQFFFHIENPSSSAWHYDNVFRDITWEIMNGGCIKALGVNNLIIDNCNVGDLVESGPTTNDLYFFGYVPGGVESQYCVIRNSNRRGGTLGEGKSDIKIDSHARSLGFVIDNCSHVGGGPYTVDVGAGARVLLIGSARNLLVRGVGNVTQLRPNIADEPVRAKLIMDGGVFVTSGPGSPEGIIEAPVGSIFMRIDGGDGTSLYVKESGAGNTGWAAK